MADCRLEIIQNLLDAAEKKVVGRPTFTMNRSKKEIIVNVGDNSKAKTFTQATVIAMNLAKSLNKEINSNMYLDNVYIPGGNIVYIKPSSKYIDGMIKYDRLLENQELYESHMRNTIANEKITPSVLDEQLSLETLAEQEGLLQDYIKQGIIKSLCNL